MTLYASLSGLRIVSGTLTIPHWGLWCADLELATADAAPAFCSLTIANLTLAGFVFRQAPFAGAQSARVVGGFGGWRKTVTRRQYSFTGGVPLSMVATDLAAEVGEQVTGVAGGTIGVSFVRETAPASRILRQLIGVSWWVDARGVTHLDARPSAAIKSDFVVARRKGSTDTFSVATEDLAAWQPGATFANALVPDMQTVAGTTVRLDPNGKMRLEVMAA